MKIKSLALIGVFAFVATTGSFAQTTYRAKVQKYLEVTGSLGIFKQAVSSMIGQLKTNYSQVPEEFWVELEKEIGGTSINDLINMIEPVYKNHLTEADLDAIIKFYETPVGKKLSETTPQIMQESMEEGQKWGMALGQKIIDKLKEKGY